MNKYDGIDKRIVLNVKAYAKNLKRKAISRFMEIEDIEQELMCEILSCIGNFDSRRGELEHFVRKVLNRRSLNLLKTYTCKKRNSVIKLSEYCDELGNQKTDDAFLRLNDSLEQLIDLSSYIDEMPIKYRLLYKLVMSQHSLTEISQIMVISRSSVTRELKRMYRKIHQLKNPKETFCLFVNSGEQNMCKNLSTIELLSTKELSELAVYDLADLSEQMSHLVNHTNELKEKLEDALNLRFLEIAQNNLRNENRDTGTTKFIENGFQIVAEVPKKVTWDSEKIDEIIKNISDEKRKAIIKTSHVIDERKYQQLSPEDKTLFADARTITPGKAKFKISIPNSEEE
jgi:RNA polymerase sigma-70 factor (ECF subfamily)